MVWSYSVCGGLLRTSDIQLTTLDSEAHTQGYGWVAKCGTERQR